MVHTDGHDMPKKSLRNAQWKFAVYSTREYTVHNTEYNTRIHTIWRQTRQGMLYQEHRKIKYARQYCNKVLSNIKRYMVHIAQGNTKRKNTQFNSRCSQNTQEYLHNT